MRYLLVVAMLALTVSAFAATTSDQELASVTINVAPYCAIDKVDAGSADWWFSVDGSPGSTAPAETQNFTAVANFAYDLNLDQSAMPTLRASWEVTSTIAGPYAVGAVTPFSVTLKPTYLGVTSGFGEQTGTLKINLIAATP